MGNGADDDSPTFTGMAALRSKVFETIRARLEDRGVDVSELRESQFFWCLPRDNNVEWESLLQDPLTTSIELLSRILDLRSSTAASVASKGNTNFYVQTYELSTLELSSILHRLLEDGLEYVPKIYQWLESLRQAPADQRLYVRYCGQTSESTSYHRFRKDLNYRGGSFKYHFLSKLRRLHPECIQNATIQEFVSAEIQFSADQSICDIREQFIIAMFDTGSLNTETGGKQTTFVPSLEDQEIFSNLGTSVTQSVTQSTNKPSMDLLVAISQYAHSARSYANEHPLSCGTNCRFMTEAMERVIFEQAIPSLLHNGYTPTLIIGSDLVDEHLDIPQPFFISPGRGPRLAAMTLNYFANWEQTLNRFDASLTYHLYNSNHLPFINLYPWYNKAHQDLADAITLMQGCLRALKPLVVVTFSELVAQVAVGRFEDKAYIRLSGYKDFFRLVGSPFLSQCKETSRVEDSWVVVVPSYHPGIVNYAGSTGVLGAKLFMMVSAIGWLARHEAIRRTNSPCKKLEICKEILQVLKTKTGPDTLFGLRMAALKQEFASAWSETRQVRLKAEELTASPMQMFRVEPRGKKKKVDAEPLLDGSEIVQIWKKASEELKFVLSWGFAHGASGSPLREQDARALYRGSLLKDMRRGSTEVEAVAFARTLEKGQSYFLGFGTRTEVITRVPYLMQCFSRDDELLEDAQSSRVSLSLFNKWLRGKSGPDTSTEDRVAIVKKSWRQYLGERLGSLFPLFLDDQEDETLSTGTNGPVEININTYKPNGRDSSARYSIKWKDTISGRAYEVTDLIMGKQVLHEAGETRLLHL